MSGNRTSFLAAIGILAAGAGGASRKEIDGLTAVAKEFGVKTGVLVHPTRLACCGKPAGPSLYHLIAILGKQRTLERIDRALHRMG